MTGYLGSIGAQAVLLRSAAEGGRYLATITRTIIFEQALGLVENNMLLDLDNLGPEHQRIKFNLQTGQTAFGEFTRLGPLVEMFGTP